MPVQLDPLLGGGFVAAPVRHDVTSEHLPALFVTIVVAVIYSMLLRGHAAFP